MKLTRISKLLTSTLLLSLAVPATADYTVYYQQGTPVRLNGHPLPIIYEDGDDVELRADAPDTNFDGGTAGGDGVEGPDSLAAVEPGSAYLLKFEEILSGKYVPIPAGTSIVSAYLVLDFGDTGDPLDMRLADVPWDGETETWNSLGTPDDGVSAADAVHVRDVIQYSEKLAIDVTGEVAGWAGGAPNQGWAFLPSGGDEAAIKTNHFLDPEQLNGGLPLWVPTGIWGVRDAVGVLQLTDPRLLNEGAFGRPALIINFVPEPGHGPGFGVGAAAGPPPGGPPGGPPPPGGAGGAGGGPGGGDGGGGGGPGGAPGGGVGNIQKDPRPGEPGWVWWYGWPDTVQCLEESADLKRWLDTGEAVEWRPGCFVRRIADDQEGNRFFRPKVGDSDGDGAPDRKGGVNATPGEGCAENALADLFRFVEQTGRTLREEDEEFNRTTHAHNINLTILMYKFLSNYSVGGHAVPFQRTVEGFLTGNRNLKPILPDGSLNFAVVTTTEARDIMVDALDYIRFLMWWQLVYNGDSFSSDQKDAIRQFIDDLGRCQNQLSQLDKKAADFRQRVAQVQQQICQKFEQQRAQTASPVAELATKLFVWIGQKGTWGLFKLMLSDNFGKSFIDGTLKVTKGVADLVIETINSVSTLLQRGEFIEAQCKFNEALCQLVDAAKDLPKFQIAESSVLNYELLHSDSVHGELHSTVLEPLIVCYNPEGGRPAGKGGWEAEALEIVEGSDGGGPSNVHIKSFSPESATLQGSQRVTETFIKIPEIEEGQKCYVVLIVKRIFKSPSGGPGREVRQNYFVGVVQNR